MHKCSGHKKSPIARRAGSFQLKFESIRSAPINYTAAAARSLIKAEREIAPARQASTNAIHPREGVEDLPFSRRPFAGTVAKAVHIQSIK